MKRHSDFDVEILGADRPARRAEVKTLPIVARRSGSPIYEEIVPPKQGFARVILRGQHLRVTDVMGKQVADMVWFNEKNTKEKNSIGISLSRQKKPFQPYRLRDRLTTGDIIFSTAYRPMATIVADTPVPGGVHQTIFHMCNRELYESLGFPGYEGCWEILSRALEPYSISPEEIPDAFGPFCNLEHDVSRGEWHAREPVSRPGDFIEFRLEMECIVGLSNCPEDVLTPINGWVCTPLKIEIYEGNAR